jgi:hypothetical protein
MNNLQTDIKYHLTLKSANSKTGPMAVSTTAKASCPDKCPLKKAGCFADGGPLQLHWEQVSQGKRGVEFDDFLLQLAALKKGAEYRHNQAGDLPPKEDEQDTIDAVKLAALAAVVKLRKLRAFTYTHYPVIDNETNQQAIKAANDSGFTINLSANNISEVDPLLVLNVAPVAVIMPLSAPKVSFTAAGNKIVICPAQTNAKTTCVDCMLCQKSDRSFSIGFYPHGTSAKKAITSTNNQG